MATVCTDVAHCVSEIVALQWFTNTHSNVAVIYPGVVHNPSPIPPSDVVMAQACYQWDGYARYKFAIFPASCVRRSYYHYLL